MIVNKTNTIALIGTRLTQENETACKIILPFVSLWRFSLFSRLTKLKMIRVSKAKTYEQQSCIKTRANAPGFISASIWDTAISTVKTNCGTKKRLVISVAATPNREAIHGLINKRTKNDTVA